MTVIENENYIFSWIWLPHILRYSPYASPSPGRLWIQVWYIVFIFVGCPQKLELQLMDLKLLRINVHLQWMRCNVLRFRAVPRGDAQNRNAKHRNRRERTNVYWSLLACHAVRLDVIYRSCSTAWRSCGLRTTRTRQRPTRGKRVKRPSTRETWRTPSECAAKTANTSHSRKLVTAVDRYIDQ